MAYIKMESVSVEYKLLNASISSIKQLFPTTKKPDKLRAIKAINNIDLTIEAGDRVGLIGRNGAGKTTLLKVMSYIYQPTKGIYSSQGEIYSLLGVGFGMDEEATGYENIILGGITIGWSLKKARNLISEIADFTQLGEFLDLPIRTYSAGMKAKLAFSIATAAKPDILIMDEWISAGDEQFIDRAKIRLEEFIKNSSILILASHSTEILRKFCNKIIYLDQGKIIFYGSCNEGLELYNKSHIK